MFLNIRIDWIILKTYDQQFTLTTKKSLHIIFKGKFSKMFPKGFTASQQHVSCANFVKMADRKSAKSCVVYLTKKQNFRKISRSCFCADRAQNLLGQLQTNETIYSEFPKFHPNPFTSGGVIAERVNIVETRHKVFPILGQASSPPSKYSVFLSNRIMLIAHWVTEVFSSICLRQRHTSSLASTLTITA